MWRDLQQSVGAQAIALTLLDALDSWAECKSRLQQLYPRLNAGQVDGAPAFDPRQAAAPLPRAPQW